MGIRTSLAIMTAKIAEKASKNIFHRQGVTWAGKLALMIDPNIITNLSKKVRKDIFMVCGTNGKTTTNNLLAEALEAEGFKVICNSTGSNMLNGVAACFALSAKLSGKLDADYACIEVDEASTRRVTPFMKPNYLLITNLFRDQLDRYGEIDITMDILMEVINKLPDMKVVINGDDVLLAYMAYVSKNEFITFGIKNRTPFDNSNKNEIREGAFCKICGAPLTYNFYHYGQLGDYYCTNCDFKRPDITYNGSNIDLSSGISFEVENRKLKTDYKGFYNVYNILAAYSVARASGLTLKKFEQMLSKFNPKNGRLEEFNIDGTKIVLNLAKNPAGFNQNINVVMNDKELKDIIIVINDNGQDGKDVSWLWDVDFNLLKGENINKVIVSGIRGLDMGLRMKYEDTPYEIAKDVENAITERIENGCNNLYLLVNYTALFTTQGILQKLEKEQHERN
jgi:UDP-N-acetylmuramyl tripeptide synthase